MIEFNKWVVLKATPLLILPIVPAALLLATLLQAEAAVIKDLRIGNNSKYVRMVLEFDQPLIPSPTFSLDRNTLQVTLNGIINNLKAPQTGEYRNDIVSLDVSRKSDARRIDVVFSFDPANINTFSLTDPHRFIIDAYRPVSTIEFNRPNEREVRQKPSVEEIVFSPEPSAEPKNPARPGLAAFIQGLSMKAYGSVSPNNSHTDDWRRNRFQQRLIAALIIVTSIIVVLLFFLIWMGSGKKKRAIEPSWTHHLPPTTDRDIESIDAVIREYLNNHDHP